MNPSNGQDESVDRSVDQIGKFDVRWAFFIVGQCVLGVIALTADEGSRAAAKAQGSLLLISVLAVLCSLLLVPRIGLAKVYHAAPIVSLAIGLMSLVFVVDFSLLAKHGMAIGVVSVIVGLFALRNLAAAWGNRFRQ